MEITWNTNANKYDTGGIMVDAEIKCGETGISTDKKSLLRLGWLGKAILDYRELVSQRKFNTSIESNMKDSGKIHIPIKIVGTITGRCSSGDFG